jgi:hypothetical protein
MVFRSMLQIWHVGSGRFNPSVTDEMRPPTTAAMSGAGRPDAGKQAGIPAPFRAAGGQFWREDARPR